LRDRISSQHKPSPQILLNNVLLLLFSKQMEEPKDDLIQFLTL
jgi:hypothetical protein